MDFSNRYIIGFSLALCLVCSLAVSSVAVALKDRQELNKRLDQQVKVLALAGLLPEEGKPSPEEAVRLFEEKVKLLLVDRSTGEHLGEVPFGEVDPVAEAKDPATSSTPSDPAAQEAQIRRVPNRLLVFVASTDEGEVLVLPIWGNGLWSTMYGYLALDGERPVVDGIVFYQHGETPGLGGEIDNPGWRAQWPGKEFWDSEGNVVVEVVKSGHVRDPKHQVDGISGATLTSRGVDATVRFWLGPEGYGPFLKRHYQEASR